MQRTAMRQAKSEAQITRFCLPESRACLPVSRASYVCLHSLLIDSSGLLLQSEAEMLAMRRDCESHSPTIENSPLLTESPQPQTST